MGESTWTTMHIGGALPANKREELEEAIRDDFHDLQSDGEDIDPAVAEKRSLLVQGHCRGEPDTVIAFCEDYSLPFWLHYDAGTEWSAFINVWKPGMEKVSECAADSQDYKPVISLDALIHRAGKGATLASVVEYLSAFDPDKVPPLTIGPDHHTNTDEQLDVCSSPTTDLARG